MQRGCALNVALTKLNVAIHQPKFTKKKIKESYETRSVCMCFVKSALDPQVVRSAVVFFWVDPWPLDACRLNRQIIYIVNIVHGSKRNERKRQAASKCATKIIVSKVVRLRSRRTCHSSCPGRCCSRCHWHWQQGSVPAALGPSAAIAETRRSSAWNLYEFANGVVICKLRVKYRMVLVQKTKIKNKKHKNKTLWK